ncbi:MAG: fibrobacter succinogenes major paralogous domain-containing protein [Fibromonadales bacterium]|nr:fibrobacter succinogenes major paralogous domain-containing protein [Fibromonadales bacterium]
MNLKSPLSEISISLALALTVSCSSDEGENEPKDPCKKVEYNPQTQFCFEGNVSNKEVFTDARDGKEYRYVKIGNQTWMAENLNYSGDGSIGRCYEDEPANCDKYGRLYYWYKTIRPTLSEATDVCPSGWHLPSAEEWRTLIDFAGGNEIAGKKLKARDGWDGLDTGTDDYGFSALPGGYAPAKITAQEYEGWLIIAELQGYNIDVYFSFMGMLGLWWSSTEDDFISSIGFSIYDTIDQMAGGDRSGKFNLKSVRCVKN